METMITLLTPEKIGLLSVGLGGVLMAAFLVYYIAFAITIFTGSISSAVKILAAEAQGAVWTPGLGITMADGGRPRAEEEEHK